MITGRPKKPVNILLVIRAMRVRMPHCELKWEMSDIVNGVYRAVMRRLRHVQFSMVTSTVV